MWLWGFGLLTSFGGIQRSDTNILTENGEHYDVPMAQILILIQIFNSDFQL